MFANIQVYAMSKSDSARPCGLKPIELQLLNATSDFTVAQQLIVIGAIGLVAGQCVG
jgi:hypothetical protein